MIDDFYVRPVTILRAGRRTDRYGNQLEDDWAEPTRTDLKGWVTQVTGSEDQDQRDALVTQLLLELPAGTDIDGRCRVLLDNDDTNVFEVVGEPTRPWSPRGEHRVKATLQLVAG